MLKQLVVLCLFSSIPLSASANDDFPGTWTRSVFVPKETIEYTRDLMRKANNPLADVLHDGYITEGLGLYCNQRKSGTTDEQYEQIVRDGLKKRTPDDAARMFNYMSSAMLVGRDYICPSVGSDCEMSRPFSD